MTVGKLTATSRRVYAHTKNKSEKEVAGAGGSKKKERLRRIKHEFDNFIKLIRTN